VLNFNNALAHHFIQRTEQPCHGSAVGPGADPKPEWAFGHDFLLKYRTKPSLLMSGLFGMMSILSLSSLERDG
jgi:hypothetical protein